jgi:periplasmic divalent cation tolerance protein
VTDSLIIVTTTVADRPAADKLARSLVESCHAACVQVVPEISSTYYWQGEVCVEAECMLLIKTLASKYAELEVELRSLHPYDEPEIVAMPASAVSQSYLQWAIEALARQK